MPAISWQHDRRKILLPVSIFRPGHSLDLTSAKATALVDTGATTSGIGRPIISELDLISYGKKRLKSAREESFAPYYLFRIGLFGDLCLSDPSLPTVPLPYIFPETDGFSWSHATEFQVILGMDILKLCDLQIDRLGNCKLAFG